MNDGCGMQGRLCVPDVIGEGGFANRENVVCVLGCDLSGAPFVPRCTLFLRPTLNLDVCVPNCVFWEDRAAFSSLSSLVHTSSLLLHLSPLTHTHPIHPRRKMPAYHHPPAYRLTVPLLLLLLTAGGLVLTTIRSYPTLQTINEPLQKVLDRPSQTSLNDLFDTIGSHPDRESTVDYNYCQARRPDIETYPHPKVKEATMHSSFARNQEGTSKNISPTKQFPTFPMPMQSLGQGC